MNIKHLSGLKAQLIRLQKRSQNRIADPRQKLIEQGRLKRNLTPSEVMRMAKKLSQTNKKNLLYAMLKSKRYRDEVLTEVIHSGVLGSVEQILGFVAKAPVKTDIVTGALLAKDFFLHQTKSDQKRIVIANQEKISKNFLHDQLGVDEQYAIKVLISLPAPAFNKIMDGLFVYSEDNQIFDSSYLSEASALDLVQKLNDRRLQKVLMIPANFLLIGYAARLNQNVIVRLLETAEPKSICRFVEFCIDPEFAQPGIRRLSAKLAFSIYKANLLNASRNQEYQNIYKVYHAKILQDPRLAIKYLQSIVSDEEKLKYLHDFAYHFGEPKGMSAKVKRINRKQLLIDLLAMISTRRDLLDKVFESVSNEYTLKIEKLLKEENK